MEKKCISCRQFGIHFGKAVWALCPMCTTWSIHREIHLAPEMEGTSETLWSISFILQTETLSNKEIMGVFQALTRHPSRTLSWTHFFIFLSQYSLSTTQKYYFLFLSCIMSACLFLCLLIPDFLWTPFSSFTLKI